VAAADALAALGKDATAALDPLLAALAGKDEVKALQASRALMGMGAGAKDATQKIVDAFCTHPGPARFYLGEALRAIGPASIPILVQKTSPYLPVASRAKGQPDKCDPALLRDAAKALKNFGTAAKESTPYLEKAAAGMPPGQGSYKEYIAEALEVVNGRPTKRVSVMGKHRFPCPLGPDDGSSKPDTTSKKGTDVDEP